MVVGAGAIAFGTRGYGHDALHDLPTVTVDGPTAEQVFTTGGPSITVSWTYGQAQNDAQSQYRVRVLSDDGTTTVYYDSGWLSGTAASKAINLVAAGVAGDETDVSVEVSVRSNGTAWQKVSSLRPFQLEWGIPSVASVLEPDPVESSPDLTVEWTYSDTQGKAQAKYRVRLMTSDEVVLHDSGWRTGAGTTYAIPVKLVDNSVYKVGIRLQNAEGVKS